MIRPNLSSAADIRLRQGMTLAEMMIVVAILALIIALLLPAVDAVRKSAVRVACLSNLRQLAQAAMIYASNNDGSLPYACQDLARHYINLSATLDKTYVALGFPDVLDAKGNPNGLPVNPVWHCPADGYWPSISQWAPVVGAGQGRPANFLAINANVLNTSYMYLGNGLNAPAVNSYEKNYKMRPVKLRDTVNHAPLPIFADNVLCPPTVSGSAGNVVSNHGIQLVGYTHVAAVGQNQVFTDGHAQWVTLPSPLDTSSTTPPSNASVIHVNNVGWGWWWWY